MLSALSNKLEAPTTLDDIDFPVSKIAFIMRAMPCV
jgi:hypothetical protein